MRGYSKQGPSLGGGRLYGMPLVTAPRLMMELYVGEKSVSETWDETKIGVE